jgi:hypothetical protein
MWQAEGKTKDFNNIGRRDDVSRPRMASFLPRSLDRSGSGRQATGCELGLWL